jgi:hypothetical protein
MAEAKSLIELMQIRAHNREFLDSINGNLGTALGFKKKSGENLSSHPAIIVFVPMKINPKWIPGSQMIPDQLNGPGNLWCALDVVEGGKAEYEKPVPESPSELAERLRGWDDNVWSGSQVSHWIEQTVGSYSIGTLGAFAKRRDNDSKGFLTNMHVGIEPGQQLFHPVPWGTHIGTTHKAIEYVEDQHWYGPLVDEPSTLVRADCAFVELATSFEVENINPHMMGVGQLGAVKEISMDDMSIIGQRVLRVGRTTGLRYGTIMAFGYEFVDQANVSVYTDLLIVGDGNIPFSTHGDSGSLIVTNDHGLNPIGLLWGGWQEKLRTGRAQENWTYGVALSRVLDALRIDLIVSL